MTGRKGKDGMKNLYAGQESALLRKKADRFRRGVLGLGILSAVLVAVLFGKVTTGNAAVMVWVILGSMTVLGWGCILLLVRGYFPAKEKAAHAGRLENGEKTVCEGALRISPATVRIPKSVPVRQVTLQGESGELSLRLDEDLLPWMPEEGMQVRAETAHRYIVGVENLDGSDPVPRGREAAPRRMLRFLQRLREMIPLLLAWTVVAGMLGGFIFLRVTDAPPENKITIYMDGKIQNAAELAYRLERQLPAPIRKVQIRPFTYAMFSSEELRSADLYIVPRAHLAEYRDWFLPDQEGKVMYDPEEGLSIAEKWLIYESPEPYLLLRGAGSCHREDGLAERAAATLLMLDGALPD